MDEIEEEEQHKNTIRSRPSFDSIQEISYSKEPYFRYSLILINIISFISGVYILYHRDFYLNPKYKFTNYRSLYVFIITYTLGMLAALILSFSIALIAKIFVYIRNKRQNNTIEEIPNQNLFNNEQQSHSRISLFILNNKPNEIAIIPFTLSYFIALTIGLYFIVLPYAFCLIINLVKNDIYKKFIDFFWLYFFMVINLLAGAIMIIVLFYMVFKKRSGSVRKFEYPVDNSNIENIRQEVREAIKI